MNQSNSQPVSLDRVTNEQLNLVNEKFKSKAPEVWRDIAELNFAVLRLCPFFAGISDDELAVTAVNLVYQLVADFGGSQLYIPRGTKYQAELMYAQIDKEFDGGNVRQLAAKNKITPMRVHQILAANRTAKKAKKKGELVL